ncbi:MAG TPA: hypothetical protein VM848_12875 [Acidimicrobiia bacterium]|nr:hypothetical protein [Acidimicrobiia bacterium]
MNRLDDILIRYKRSATWWLAGIVFLLLSILLRFAIDQPPVWDGAMSVYPAAIELSRTNFDFARLFSLPTFYEGGPNTHATSPWTMLVAALISLTGSLASALPILHTISFGLAALTVAATYRLIAHTAPGIVAVVGALAVLVFPPMLVQTADVYLDLPLTCFGIWSLVMLVERRFIAASALVTMAVWIKPLAIIFAAVGAAFVFSQGDPQRRIRRTIVLAAPPLVVAAIVSLLQSASSVPPPLLDRYVVSIGGSSQWLGAMPDLIGLGIVTLLLIPAMIKSGVRQDTFTIMSLVLLSAVLLVLLNPLVSFGIPFIPRYYIAILPAMIAGVLSFLSSKSRLLALSAASALIVIFVVNLNGALYPYKDHPTYALAERSFAFRDLLALQIEDVGLLTELGQAMPVYYDYFGFYRLEYPELGYSKGPLESGISVFHNPELAGASLENMPARFAFIYEYPVLGGEFLQRIWDEAKASGAEVTETPLTRGTFTVYVVEVNQGGAVSP